MEFAIRYASDQGWRGATDGGIYDLNRLNGITRTLGNGSFTINYNNATGDILTSTGQITGSTESRVVRVSSFSDFLRLVFTTPAPAWTTGTRRALFYIINVRVPNVTLLSFSASWTAQNNRTISTIYFNGNANANRRYTGAYANNSGPVNFNINGNSYTISPTPPSASTPVYIYWNNNLGTNSQYHHHFLYRSIRGKETLTPLILIRQEMDYNPATVHPHSPSKEEKIIVFMVRACLR